MKTPRIGLALTAHPNEVGFDLAQSLRKEAAGLGVPGGFEFLAFEGVISDIRGADEALEFFLGARLDGLVVLTATWSDDFLALRLVEGLDLPVFTWAVRGVHRGSLCGTQQLDMVLAELGRRFVFHFGEAGDPATAAALGDFAFACGARSLLRRLRVGLIGRRTFGMTEIAVDEIELRRLLGAEVVPLSMRRFKSDVDQIGDDAAGEVWARAKTRVARVQCAPEAGLFSAKVMLALKNMAERHRLGAVAVDCYPDFMGRFCLAASLLADEGLVVGCEGDVNGAVAQTVIHYLTGGPAHNTDLLDVDLENGTALFSHCGSGSLSLAASPEETAFAPVRLADEGLCVLFPGKPGPVTMINLVGRAGTYRLSVVDAEAVETDMAFPGNPVRIALPGGGRVFLDFVAENALGHHWMIGYGHVADRLAQLALFVGLPEKTIR